MSSWVYNEPVVEWIFNPALLSIIQTSAGIVYGQGSIGKKILYNTNPINMIDYFDYHQIGEGGGAYYIFYRN